MLILEFLNWLALPIVGLIVVKKCRAIRERDGKKLEICAASSAAMVILNPDLLSLLLWHLFGISYAGLWAGAGNSELLSFTYSVVTIILSMIGMRRIMRNPDKLYGNFYAILGLLLGLAIVCFWLWVGYTLFSGWT